MRIVDAVRKRLAVITWALLLAGCAGGNLGPTQSGPAIPAPTLKVGDRWVYHYIDGYRTKTEWNETHQVMAIDASGITVQIMAQGPSVNSQRTEKWSAPGVVLDGAVFDSETDQFDPPLIRYQYPLTPGTSWYQRIRNVLKPPGPYGPIMRDVKVEGYETVTTPAGTFNALRLKVIMTLDDETFWRYPTQCTYTIWYADAVGALVQEDKRSQSRDKNANAPQLYNPGQNTQIQLVSFTRG